MLRTLLRPAVLLPSLVFVLAMVLFALKDSPAVWFALLIAGGAALPVIAIHFSRHAGEDDTTSDGPTKPE